MDVKNIIKDRKRLSIIVAIGLVFLTLIGVVVYFVNQVNQKDEELAEVVEMMNFEKQQVEQEFADLNSEISGYTVNIKNDSLFKLLDNEKAKVKNLLEELRATKATSARRIAELKKELATVRSVMIHYINQIDQLNAENKELRTENTEVKKKYQEASDAVSVLSKEKESLHEVVTRASKLDVINFSMTPLTSKGKKTNWFSSIGMFQLNYTVAKNVTAKPGLKTVYVRITRPDDNVLVKSSSNTFPFEGKNITYSAKKDFEFAGEAHADVIYWKVEEIIQKGTYRADFFIDGSIVGSFTFEAKK